jgi:hypothetical protein
MLKNHEKRKPSDGLGLKGLVRWNYVNNVKLYNAFCDPVSF